MTPEQLELLKYPIGKYSWPETITKETLDEWVVSISELPSKLEILVLSFSEEQLDTPYRPGGWTVRQVVHHLVDSHVNSYVRYKWTLTEDCPVIKTYHEDRWAELNDYKADVKLSLQMLKALHIKWVFLLKVLTEEDFSKTFVHPETAKEISLRRLTGLYAWHGEHHYAHIAHLANRKGGK